MFSGSGSSVTMWYAASLCGFPPAPSRRLEGDDNVRGSIENIPVMWYDVKSREKA